MNPDQFPTPHRHGLRKFFHDAHGLTLTSSELDEIEREVLKSNDQDRVDEAVTLKKLLRCGRSHKTEAKDIREVIETLERWEAMRVEDSPMKSTPKLEARLHRQRLAGQSLVVE